MATNLENIYHILEIANLTQNLGKKWKERIKFFFSIIKIDLFEILLIFPVFFQFKGEDVLGHFSDKIILTCVYFKL